MPHLSPIMWIYLYALMGLMLLKADLNMNYMN